MRPGALQSIAFLTVLSACPGGSDGPLPPEQLAPFQTCTAAAECWVAKNQPRGCCRDTTFDNYVAVARAKIGDLEKEFADPSCDGAPRCLPPIDDAVLANRYELSCTNGQCTILEEHVNAGQSCSDAMPCPDQYSCVDQPNSAVCFFEGDPQNCTLAIDQPTAPERPSEVMPAVLEPCRRGWDNLLGPGGGSYCDPWMNQVERTCGEAGADFPDAQQCEQIHEPCGSDGYPQNLPNDGTPIVRVARGGSIADAIAAAAPGTIIATSTGAYAEPLFFNKPLTLWGCGEQTEVSGMITVVSARIRIENLIVRGPNAGIVTGAAGATTIQRVLISGTAGPGWVLSDSAVGVGEMMIIRACERAIDVRSQARLELTHVSIDENGSGVSASGAGTSATLVDVVASRNQSGAAIASDDGAIVTANGIVLQENGRYALHARGGMIDATEVFATTTGLLEPDNESSAGAVASERGTLLLSRAYFERNFNASIFAHDVGTRVTLNHVVIENTLFAASERLAAGIDVQAGATLEAMHLIISDSGGAALAVSGEASSADVGELIVDRVKVSRSAQTSAIVVYGRASLTLEGAVIAGSEGVGATASGEATVLDLRGVRFEDLADVGIYADTGARVEAEIVSIARARRAGLWVRGAGTTAALVALSIDAVLPHKDDGPGGFGAAISHGARAEISATRVSLNHHAGIVATGTTTVLILRDVEVSGTLASLEDASAGRGVSIEGGAHGIFDTVAVRDNLEIGLLAIGEGSGVEAHGVLIERTTGIGAASYAGATMELDPFFATGNTLAGVARGASSVLTLGEGRIEKSPIGASLEGSADVSKICFDENVSDVVATDLGLPSAIDLD